MDEKQLKASLRKYFGETAAKITKETTEDEIKRIYAARSATYDEVLQNSKIIIIMVWGTMWHIAI